MQSTQVITQTSVLINSSGDGETRGIPTFINHPLAQHSFTIHPFIYKSLRIYSNFSLKHNMAEGILEAKKI